MSDKGSALAVEEVSVQFGAIKAIDTLSFQAKPSEFLAVIGPNGAGKTVLLNVISGIYRPSRGRILLDGQDLAGVPLHRRVRHGIGRAFQHAELFPHLTVTENLLIGRHMRFTSGSLTCALFWGKARREELEERGRVEAVIDAFELYRHRDAPVGSLPYGVQKMVGVARALTMEPKLLLLDEPSTGLIREERENLARFLLRISHEMVPTILWVEHDMQMVSDLAQRVVVLHHGAKIAEGTPEEVRNEGAVIEAYLGPA